MKSKWVVLALLGLAAAALAAGLYAYVQLMLLVELRDQLPIVLGRGVGWPTSLITGAAALVGGFLSDRFGARIVLVLSVFAPALVGVASFFTSENAAAYWFGLALLVGNSCSIGVVFTLITRFFAPKHRVLAYAAVACVPEMMKVAFDWIMKFRFSQSFIFGSQKPNAWHPAMIFFVVFAVMISGVLAMLLPLETTSDHAEEAASEPHMIPSRRVPSSALCVLILAGAFARFAYNVCQDLPFDYYLLRSVPVQGLFVTTEWAFNSSGLVGLLAIAGASTFLNAKGRSILIAACFFLAAVCAFEIWQTKNPDRLVGLLYALGFFVGGLAAPIWSLVMAMAPKRGQALFFSAVYGFHLFAVPLALFVCSHLFAGSILFTPGQTNRSYGSLILGGLTMVGLYFLLPRRKPVSAMIVEA